MRNFSFIAACSLLLLAAAPNLTAGDTPTPLRHLLASTTVVEESKAGPSRIRIYRGGGPDRLLRVEESVAPDGTATVIGAPTAADHIVVRIRPGTTEAEIHQLSTQLGGRVVRRIPAIDTVVIRLAQAKADSVTNALREAQASPLVEHVERDVLAVGDVTPNDPQFNGYQQSLKQVMAHKAWRVTTGSSSVVVAVIDSGVQYDHPDLAANMWSNAGEIDNDGIDNDGDGYIDDVRGWDWVAEDKDPADGHGHGTHCAGILGAVGNNGTGIAGVSWNVRIMPLRVLDDSNWGWYSDWALAMTYAVDKGATILSMSLGGTSPSSVLQSAVNYVESRGGLMVICAGNDGIGAAQYPAACTGNAIIAVAAANADDSRASWSNYSYTTVDLAAPGDSIRSTYRDSAYAWMSGTSMATPHVSGACALLKAYKPMLTATQIRTAILDGVDVLPAWSGLTATGGRLNIRKSLNLVGANITNATPLFSYADNSLATPEDTTGSKTLTASDSDNDLLYWKVSVAPTKGTASVSTMGTSTSVVYTPNADANGADSFTVQVSDHDGGTATFTLAVTIAASNDPPVCTAIPTLSGSSVVGGTLTASTGSWNDLRDTAQGGSSAITYAYAWWRADDNLGTNASAIPGASTSAYVATDEDVGHWLQVQVTASDDGIGGPATTLASESSVWRGIAGLVNSSPVITMSATLAVQEDIDQTFTLSASDVDGDTLSWSITSQGLAGTATVTGPTTAIYASHLDLTGPDSFTILVDDGHGGTDTLVVAVTIAAINDAPRFTIPLPQLNAIVGMAFSRTLDAGWCSDPDGDSLAWSVSGQPPWVSFNPATRTLSGTPTAADVGLSSLSVTVEDPALAAASTTVILNVTPQGIATSGASGGGGSGGGGGCGAGLIGLLIGLVALGIASRLRQTRL